jgi:hypothetical protein
MEGIGLMAVKRLASEPELIRQRRVEVPASQQLPLVRASFDAEAEIKPTTLEEIERGHILKALTQTRWLVGGRMEQRRFLD